MTNSEKAFMVSNYANTLQERCTRNWMNDGRKCWYYLFKLTGSINADFNTRSICDSYVDETGVCGELTRIEQIIGEMEKVA